MSCHKRTYPDKRSAQEQRNFQTTGRKRLRRGRQDQLLHLPLRTLLRLASYFTPKGMKPDYLTEFDSTPKALAVMIARRGERHYQRRCRGDGHSPSDLYENAAILAALEAGEITEGQAARALGEDRVSTREKKLRLIALGRALAYALKP